MALRNMQNILSQLRQLGVENLSLDSRCLDSTTAFVALQGQKQHGLMFLDQAIRAHAPCILMDTDDPGGKNIKNLPVIFVPKLASQLGKFASSFYHHPSQQLKIHAVTGTNGKTSCSQFIAQALTLLGERCGVIGTLGMGIWPDLKDISNTTPDAITIQRFLADCVAQGVKHVSMEASSIALDQGRMQGCEINSAIFTNLTQDHLDYHHTMAAYGEAKKKLFAFSGLKHAMVNVDDQFGQKLFAWMLRTQKKVDCVGTSASLSSRATLEQDAHCVYALKANFTHEGIAAQIQTSQGIGELKSSLLGRFNLENLLLVLSWMLSQAIPLKKALEIVLVLKNAKGRLEGIHRIKKPTVVIDYAHTPDALEKALQALREHCLGKLWCVFGCGGNRDKTKRPIMGNIAMKIADHVVITSDNPRDEDPAEIIGEIALGIHGSMLLSGQVMMMIDRAEAIKYAIKHAAPADMILIAGKGHETYQEINGKKIPFDDVEVAKKILSLK